MDFIWQSKIENIVIYSLAISVVNVKTWFVALSIRVTRVVNVGCHKSNVNIVTYSGTPNNIPCLLFMCT